MPPHQFASTAIHCPFGFTNISAIADSAVKAIAVYESIGFMHVCACTKRRNAMIACSSGSIGDFVTIRTLQLKILTR
jgi:hypothetical protein